MILSVLYSMEGFDFRTFLVERGEVPLPAASFPVVPRKQLQENIFINDHQLCHSSFTNQKCYLQALLSSVIQIIPASHLNNSRHFELINQTRSSRPFLISLWVRHGKIDASVMIHLSLIVIYEDLGLCVICQKGSGKKGWCIFHYLI